MSKLNKDILFLIFEELKKDSKTLFSCLMVNRVWSETVIPILWRNPWCYNINYNNKVHLFAIIASYLPDHNKKFLTRQELPSISRQSLLFDYMIFCRSINIEIISNIISIGSPLNWNQFFLQEGFYNVIMEKCYELKYLDMRSINHQIFYFPEAKVHLGSLCELKCNTSIDDSYFYGLARICKYIQRLIIINNNIKTYYGIVKLIEVQKNLKYFEWKDEFSDYYFVENAYEEILLELEKKADLIIHLRLFFQFVCNEHSILQKILPKFIKLKTLIIDDFGYCSEVQLKKLVYHDLEILNIDYITISTVSNIIENSGGHLREILLKHNDFADYEENFSQDTLIFIRKIYEKCPTIEYLSIVFSPSKEHFNEFEKLLNVCQNLKSLLLIISIIYERETDEEILKNGEELLNILIRSAPFNLREIRFHDDFKISLKNLEEFLEKWKGRPALSILTSDPTYNDNDYVKLINKYKNDGVIKDFIYDSRENIYFSYEK
ncbi:hypothetical protein C1645_880217 [Glomus cerebriforme]|uniref:F-box domain-containing protein n=1 Tax=Glomus cerebriforme TaxID=658196 RepID=A0A397SIE9_9GLOM|nr:hypothetical protein C1645_880217 [Glomus cerebriforme]